MCGKNRKFEDSFLIDFVEFSPFDISNQKKIVDLPRCIITFCMNLNQQRSKELAKTFEDIRKEKHRFEIPIAVGMSILFLWCFIGYLVKSDFVMAVLAIVMWMCFLWIVFKNDLHELALCKGWKRLAKWSYDADYEKRKEEYSVREFFLKHPADTSTIVIIDNVVDFEELEATLFLYTDEYCKMRTNDLALLWKITDTQYAVTFPCGVLGSNLLNFVCELAGVFKIQGWCQAQLLSPSNGRWAFLSATSEEECHITSDAGEQWSFSLEEDKMKTTSAYGEYVPKPTIDLSEKAQRLNLYY